MPKPVTWNELVTAARQRRIGRLDVRGVEAAILAADEALRAAESAAEGEGCDDTAPVVIAVPVPAQRARRASKRGGDDA